MRDKRQTERGSEGMKDSTVQRRSERDRPSFLPKDRVAFSTKTETEMDGWMDR